MDSSKKHFKLSSVVLIVSVIFVTMVLGVLVDGQVVPEINAPLVLDEIPSIKDQELVSKPLQPDHLEQINQEANSTIKKAEQLITQTDNLIAQAGLPVPAGNTQIAQRDTSTAKRLLAARNKLDELKQQ